jgi:lysophospholipase L1-like esterase
MLTPQTVFILAHVLLPVLLVVVLPLLPTPDLAGSSSASNSTMSSSSSVPLVLPPDISKDRTNFARARLQLVLLGDSLTQRGSEPDGWATLLGHYYSRKADVLNRGYSGYNTNHVRAMLEQHIAHGVWPTNHAGSPASVQRKPTLLTLCLGANDSCLPEAHSAAQSVPLDKYEENLAAILGLLKGPDGKATPDLHVIVIGPPQVDDKTW